MSERSSHAGSASERAPPTQEPKVIQIAAVAFATPDTHVCTLFALRDDGTIWRLQEWIPGDWQLLPAILDIVPGKE